MNNILILIGGSAASGKSVLVKNLIQHYNAYYFSPARSYIELAKSRCIEIENAFLDIDNIDAELYFEKICLRNCLVIGDQHFSIQFEKDSKLALTGNIINTNEEYQLALSFQQVERLINSGVKILIILLTCSSDKLLERQKHRKSSTGQTIRNLTLQQIKEEIFLERYYFDELRFKYNFKNLIIDTGELSIEKTMEISKKWLDSIILGDEK